MGGGILSAEAQDIIFKQNTEEIKAKVTEITPKNIYYRLWDNPDGPLYSIPQNDVLFIKLEDGTKQIFSAAAPSVRNSSAAPAVKFQSNIELGAIFGTNPNFRNSVGGPSFDIAWGARIGRHFFAGVQTGLRSVIETVGLYTAYDYYSKTLFEGYVPLGADLRGYIPVAQNARIFVDCSLGGFFGVGDMEGLNGFTCQVGAGIEIKRFTLGLGYNALVKQGTFNSGFIKLGIRVGN